MTWGEFKRAIDEQLKKSGLGDSAELGYIDISYPTSVEEWELTANGNEFSVWDY